MTALLAQCAAHGEVTAVELCSRCGRFLCGDCLELVDEAPYCAPCSRRTPSFQRARIETLALALGVLGLVAWPVGPIAVALTARRARLPGSPWAKVALYLGGLETVLCLLAVLALALR